MGYSTDSATRRTPAKPLVVFLVCAILAAALAGYTEHNRIEQERKRAADLGAQYALALQLDIEQAMSAAYALATLVRLNHGNFPEFESTANTLRSFYPGVATLELAPGGVVQSIVPLVGNEAAIGHDLLKDSRRDKEALLARDTGKLTLAGPFQLIQGGLGAVGRMPVYFKDQNGNEQFWGFVVVLVRFPEVLAPAQLPRLEQKGYSYALWRRHPDTGDRQVIAASSTDALPNPVDRAVQMPNAIWTLSIAPRNGWVDPIGLAAKIALALSSVVLIMTGWQKLRAK